MQKEGTLIYDTRAERYDICFGSDSYYGGLHAGDCFAVYISEEWIGTRIEYSWDYERWFLVGKQFKDIQLEGLKVKI